MQLQEVEKWYSDALGKYGIDSKSVGWNSVESQNLRFKILCKVIDSSALRGGGIIINDIGCGYGALYKFLLDNGYIVKRYYGYDISQDMLCAAKEFLKDYPLDSICLENLNQATHIADFSIISGIFNTPFKANRNEWKNYIETMLFNAYEKSKFGFSFNLLTKYVDFENADLYYADPCYYFDFCVRNFSKNVSLIHGLGLWEWSILVNK